jgi:hypothetical protein
MAKQELDDDPGGRSVVFPFIGLRDAVERVRALEQVERQSFVRPERVFEIWNYSAKSSGARQTLAACRAYGLLDFKGRGDERLSRVSDRAYRIIHDAPDATVQRHAAAIDAPWHKELWERYRNEWPPTDENVRDHIKWHLGVKFTPEQATDAAKKFKDTIEYSELHRSDTIPPDIKAKDEKPGPSLMESMFGFAGLPKAKATHGPLVSEKDGRAMNQETSVIAGGNATLVWPAQLEAEDVADLAYWLRGVLRKVKRQLSPTEQAKVNDVDLEIEEPQNKPTADSKV